MQSIFNFRPFETTAILWKEVSPKFEFYNLNVIADVLNDQLTLKLYGKTVEKLMFVFIAVPPSNTVHKEQTAYIPNEKRLLLYRKLPYNKVVAYSNEEVLRLMAEAYLKNIFNLGSHEIPDFNYGHLGKDIEEIFIKLGWIVSQKFYPINRKLNINTITAFLHSKGWLDKGNTKHYHIMTSRSEQKLLKDIHLYIPLSSDNNSEQYQRAMSDMIALLSNLYNMERLELELLFSKDSVQLEQDIMMMQQVLAQAA